MADKSFGVKELNLLNASGTPTVTSPNNLNLNANTVAISTSATVGNNLTVTSTTTSANVNVTGIATVVNFNATGISTIAQPADSNPMANWTITNNSASAYRFTGPGQSGTEDNPNIYLVRGHRYIFKHNATGSHPIQIRFASGGSAYTDGITYSDTGNNRTTDGNNLIFNVQHDAPAQLFYQCTAHGGMVGNIYTVGGPQVISGVVTATTFKGALEATSGSFSSNIDANGDLDVDGHTELDNVNIAGVTTFGNNIFASGTSRFEIASMENALLDGEIAHTGDTDTKIRFPAADTISFECAGEEILKIGKSSTELLRISGPVDSSTQQEFGIGIAVNDAHTHPAAQITLKEYDASDSRGDLLFYTRGANSDSAPDERLRITSAGHVGIGTVDPAASNITTALASNTNSLAVGIVTCNQLFVSGIKVTSGGHYADLTAAAADGMNHYFPGSSSTSLISNLSTSSVGNPVVNQTADSYFNNYPYYDFYTGNAAENGYRYTQTTAKWADGPFSIVFWVKPMASTLESESTFVQLGDHPSGVLRCLYTTSTDASRQLKTITIGDDISANNTAVLSTDWNHWATTYDGSVTRYYLNGSLVRSHTHSGTLDVGTSNKYIYIGYGFWNSSASNKASMSHMSDIGIWNTKALSAATISSIYNNKRTVVGY